MSSLALTSNWYYICTSYCTPDTVVNISWIVWYKKQVEEQKVEEEKLVEVEEVEK